MIGSPTLGIPANGSKFSIDGLPRLLSSDSLACGALPVGQSPPGAVERLLRHHVRMFGAEFCQGFHQDIRITEVGQRAIDRTE